MTDTRVNAQIEALLIPANPLEAPRLVTVSSDSQIAEVVSDSNFQIKTGDKLPFTMAVPTANPEALENVVAETLYGMSHNLPSITPLNFRGNIIMAGALQGTHFSPVEPEMVKRARKAQRLYRAEFLKLSENEREQVMAS